MADDDVLSRFEQPGRGREQPPPAAQDGKPAYVAFDSQDRLIALSIERAKLPWRAPLLRYYLDISSPPRGGHFSGFTIFFTFMSVRVRGRNLKPVIDAIRLCKCDAIREYHADLFVGPPAEGEPLIESIELVVRPLHEALLDSEQQS